MEFDSFSSSAYLDPAGKVMDAFVSYESGCWKEFELGGLFPVGKQLGSYIVPALPIEFHCHGIGDYNFSDFELIDLVEINRIAKEEGILCVPSIFLPHSKLDSFLQFMNKFAYGRKCGIYPNLPAVSLEGPMLASFGGTPEKGTWMPTKIEWRKIAACGELGLNYIVLSPDAMMGSSFIVNQVTKSHPSLEWIISILAEAGIRPALGHFQKSDPEASAGCISKVLQIAHSYHSSPDAVLTDHLFNDMPLKITHAFRSQEARLHRSRILNEQQLESWVIGNLDEKLGSVPAVIMRAAQEGLLTICLNFDGEHVDLEICRRVVELVGSHSIIAMTDRTDVNLLGDQQLEKRNGSNLWYQGQNIVAAGASSIDQQMHNMRIIGIEETEIWKMVAFNAHRILYESNPDLRVSKEHKSWYSHVSEMRRRTAVNSPDSSILVNA